MKEGDSELLMIRRRFVRQDILKWNSAERVIAVTADEPLTIRILTFNFPGWTAFIDSLQTDSITESGSGALLISIPEGAHPIDLRFKDTSIRYYAKLMTLFSAFLLILFSVSWAKKQFTTKN
jgi:hypothetical protein